MKTALFISKRLVRERRKGLTFSRPVNRIVIAGIALSIAVMILAFAILTGFKQEIRNKIAGFSGHIQVLNFDSNYSFETAPISSDQEFTARLNKQRGIDNIHVFATKAGIIKTDENIQGVVLKGVSTDYDWSFFRKNLIEGSILSLSDTSISNGVIISKTISSMLNLGLGDDFAMYFVQDPPRMRKLTVEGIYETSVESMDRVYILGDIGHIRRLNGWQENQVSGFEIFIDKFNDIDLMTFLVRDAIGYKFEEDQEKLKVTNLRMKYPQILDWLNFQDTNVIVIVVLMLLVAAFTMISGLLILILEKTNMIGILKALGSGNRLIQKIFLNQAVYIIATGLLWGNLAGYGLALMQKKFEIISLDPSSYYLTTVPVNIDILHIILLNLGTILIILLMLLIPSRLVASISPVKAIKFD
ncbi:MAG: FtsX-like permease family protein [Bacteroidales bacterium]|nr:FtsX-like permease family protein [Bacteroidales bacterium]